MRSPLDGDTFMSDISVMTEIHEPLATLPPAVQRFVLQWGDMGSQWGVNRTVAQIHALLYMTDRPMPAEEIAETLGVARSNVSNSLKELLAWRLVERRPVPGDRRDHFVAETDVWEISMRIAAVRKEREFAPAIRTLEACLEEAADDPKVAALQRERLETLHGFVTSIDRWSQQMLKMPPSTLQALIKMGDRVAGLLRLGGKSDGSAG